MSNPYALVRGPLQHAIVEGQAAGRSLEAICAEPGMPCRSTVHHWTRAFPVFAESLARARRHARAVRVAFDEAAGARIVAAVAAGRRIRDILADPGMPSHGVYRRWRAQQGHFAGELHRLERSHDAERGARRAETHARPFDADIADRIYLRVLRGSGLKAALRADSAFPSYQVVTRWRREQPDFDRRMAFALSRQRSQERRARSGCTPDLVHRIAERVVTGATLAEIARARGMPSVHTLYAWKRTRPEFAEALDCAREAQAYWCEDQVQIAAEDATPAAIRATRRRLTSLKRRAAYLQKRDERPPPKTR